MLINQCCWMCGALKNIRVKQKAVKGRKSAGSRRRNYPYCKYLPATSRLSKRWFLFGIHCKYQLPINNCPFVSQAYLQTSSTPHQLFRARCFHVIADVTRLYLKAGALSVILNRFNLNSDNFSIHYPK